MANVAGPEELRSTALDTDFWEDARRRSLEPGGFGEDRVELWPRLLNAKRRSQLHSNEESSPHRDERQIRLDTDRSFVMYPVDKTKDRDSLQEELYRLLVDVFRKRPKLSYFQGYHDIITVLFLTLPPELQLTCAEKLSLHRVRDSMGASLEPVLGLLRFMKKLIRLVDPEYASLLEHNRSTPLPYFALSNLLTLFSRDMPTLPLIQHVFDYLLSRPPIMVVYLATALTLSRKQEVQRLQEEGEDGMLHSLLTGLPELTDEALSVENKDETVVRSEPSSDESSLSVTDCTRVKSEDVVPDEYIPLDEDSTKVESEDSETAIDSAPESLETLSYTDQKPDDTLVNTEEVEKTVSPDDLVVKTEEDIKLSFENEPESNAIPQETLSTAETEFSLSLDSAADSKPLPSSPPPPSPSPVPSPPEPEDSWSPHKNKPTIALSSLLRLSDSLYETYPISNPSLTLSSIMGPQSVVFTWSTSPSEMPSDDTAERMVERPELVVYPYVEELGDKEKEDGDEASRRRRRKTKRRVTELVDGKAMVAGAVLVLGVAIAVYGMKNGMINDGRVGGHHYYVSKEQLRKLGGWVGGILVGAGERFLNV